MFGDDGEDDGRLQIGLRDGEGERVGYLFHGDPLLTVDAPYIPTAGPQKRIFLSSGR